MEKNNENNIKKINILVQNLDNGSDLLSILKTRLGFKNIKKLEKGVLWSLYIDADEKEARDIAEKIAKDLLFNENYQKIAILS